MKIKKEYLNEETLKRYGFKKEVIYEGVCEYIKKCDYHEILIQRVSGNVAIVIPSSEDTDTVNLDNTLYHMIMDGIIEI